MADRYWVGGTGNWSDDTNHWATSDGGSPGAGNLPTINDNVWFTALSNGSDYTVTIDSTSLCANFTLGAPATGKVTLAGAFVLRVSGSIDLTAGTAGAVLTHSGSVQLQNATSNNTITSHGLSFAAGFTFNTSGITWSLGDDCTCAGAASLTNGTIDLQGFTFSIPSLSSSNTNVRSLKSSAPGGKLKLTGTGNVMLAATSTNFEINRNSWTIELAANSAAVVQFQGGGLTWPAVVSTNTVVGTFRFTGSNTFKSISYTGGVAHTVAFTAATTTTIEDANGFPSGSAGNVITVTSITAANHNLAKSGGGLISSDYLSISRSQATPGTTWYAGDHSTDGGNNSGWIFTSPPAPQVQVIQPAGGDSTGYRRKRRVLRRIFKRSPEARAQAEAFLAASAQTLTHAGVLPGSPQEELAAFQAVLEDILRGKELEARERTSAIVYEAVVDALLQALTAEVEYEEELEEEAIVLSLVAQLHGMRPTVY